LNAWAVTRVHISDWFSEHPSWSASTRHNAAFAIKGYYRFRYGNKHPALKITVRRDDPGPQRTLSDDELSDVVTSLDETSGKGIRDLALVSLMADTGLRASEICNSELAHLDMRRQRLSVKVKGGKWGEAVFFTATAKHLEKWLEIRPGLAAQDCRTIFVSIGGRTRGRNLTRSGLGRIAEAISRQAGIQRFSPHALRRAFATIATERGAPTRLVQAAGRWSDIRMVERFTRTIRVEALAPYSPVDCVLCDKGMK
jgi:integrase